MEAHPEVAYADDKRVIDHLATLLEEEPGLADFFQNYVERVRHEPHFWANRLVQNTQRQEAEEALRQSEEQFRGTFNSAAVGIAHVDLEGKWLLVNQKLCDILGYTQQELLERTLQNITHPDDLDTDLGCVRQMLANEIQTYLMEKRYIRKDTSLVWINLTASLIRTPKGEPSISLPLSKTSLNASRQRRHGSSRRSGSGS
jgi:PAS domain S-box-containing protein